MANITVTLYWDMDLRKWTTTLGGTTETDPIQGLVQGDIVKFAVRFVQNDLAVVLAAPVFTASGIKADNDFTGSYLIQLSAPVLSDTTLYTFTVNPLNSANLNTFLQTYRNTWCALEIYDSVNGILTTPLELQITPGYSLSGTPTTNAAGVIVVAATKTVTFPQSLTFPSALGTNGFQLSTDGAGALTWTASGALTDGDKGDITVSASGATWTIDNDVITLAKLAHMATARVVGRTTAGTGTPELLTISGTGSVAMTNTPTLVTPVLGAATATSINGITISAAGSGTLTMEGDINTNGPSGGNIDTSNYGGDINTSYGGEIDTSGNSTSVGGYIRTYGQSTLNGGYIDTHASNANGGFIDTSGENGAGGNIDTHGGGGSITTSNGGGSIDTTGNGSIGLGIAANRTYLVSTAGNNEKTATFPNVTGTVAVTAHSATTTHAMFSAGAAGYTTRAIAATDLPGTLSSGTAITNAALTTPSLGAATATSIATTGNAGLSGTFSSAPGSLPTYANGESFHILLTPPATNVFGTNARVMDIVAGAGSVGSFMRFMLGAASAAATTKMVLSNTGGLQLGGGDAIPNANAVLDLQGTTKAFMPPRVTTTQKENIASPAAGMVVYDSTLSKLAIYTGSAWETGVLEAGVKQTVSVIGTNLAYYGTGNRSTTGSILSTQPSANCASGSNHRLVFTVCPNYWAGKSVKIKMIFTNTTTGNQQTPRLGCAIRNTALNGVDTDQYNLGSNDFTVFDTTYSATGPTVSGALMVAESAAFTISSSATAITIQIGFEVVSAGTAQIAEAQLIEQ